MSHARDTLLKITYFLSVFENYYVFFVGKLLFYSVLRRIFIHRGNCDSFRKPCHGKHRLKPPYSEDVFPFLPGRQGNKKESVLPLRCGNFQQHRHRRNKKSQNAEKHKNKKKYRIKHKKHPVILYGAALFPCTFLTFLLLLSVVQQQKCRRLLVLFNNQF